MFERLTSWLGFGSLNDEQFENQRRELLKKIPIPVFWLFGKTGSGKSSIIHFITGSSQAEIGNGFQPQTRTSFQYDFPTAEEPLVRFLDTRGLGEVGYDPTEDLKAFDNMTHVIVVVARVMDHALDEIIKPLRIIREARPSRPIVLALSCLHEAYPFEQHPSPDPFELSATGEPQVASTPEAPEASKATLADYQKTPSMLARHPDLQRSLREQEQRFEGLVDRIVPIDLTRPEEGFLVPEFGGKRLEETMIELLPAACRQAILHLDEIRASLTDLSANQALPVILTYSSLAAASAASPLPWVDIPIVMALQSRMVYLLADLYDQRLNTELFLQMAGAISGRLALRFAIKAPLKFIPIVGQTANAAMAFAYTYSLGKACCWYFSEVKQGQIPSKEKLNAVWSEQLQKAVDIWRSQKPGQPHS